MINVIWCHGLTDECEPTGGRCLGEVATLDDPALARMVRHAYSTAERFRWEPGQVALQDTEGIVFAFLEDEYDPDAVQPDCVIERSLRESVQWN